MHFDQILAEYHLGAAHYLTTQKASFSVYPPPPNRGWGTPLNPLNCITLKRLGEFRYNLNSMKNEKEHFRNHSSVCVTTPVPFPTGPGATSVENNQKWAVEKGPKFFCLWTV